MSVMEFISYLIIGPVCGWLAYLIRPKTSFDLLDNIWFGMLGALVGGISSVYIGIDDISGLELGNILSAAAGGVLLITVAASFSET